MGQRYAGPTEIGRSVRCERGTWDNATLVPLDCEKREGEGRTWDSATLVPLDWEKGEGEMGECKPCSSSIPLRYISLDGWRRIIKEKDTHLRK